MWYLTPEHYMDAELFLDNEILFQMCIWNKPRVPCHASVAFFLALGLPRAKSSHIEANI